MTLEEFYKKVGGDYAEVMNRLKTEERIEKYLKMFLADESYEGLLNATLDADYEQGFAHSHNLKGMCANLGLGGLQKASSTICEELRHGTPGPDLQLMMADVTASYDTAITSIRQLQA